MSGKIHRIKHEKNFVVLDKAALQDSRLSWKAKGLHCYLMQLPDDWDINIKDLQGRSSDKRDSTTTGMHELIQHGYVSRIRITDNRTKTFVGYDYNVFEQPVSVPSETGFSVNGSSVNGFPENGESVTTKNYTHKELTELNSLSDSQAKSDEGAESFEQLWQAYGMKKGSKKTALARWSKLSLADRENIWATLDLYKRETVTEDTADRAGKFKPMRKHLERFLSARTWEAYIDRAADQKSEPPTPFDENYQKYLDWVKQHFPQVLQQTTQLSRAQFVAFKSTSYVKGVRDIGTSGEMSMFKQAHADFCQASSEARKFSDVYEYHCSLIRYRVKVRQV